ncbi:hypothetical protein ACHAW6_001332 [Cyclotella cf. meneghiniana]
MAESTEVDENAKSGGPAPEQADEVALSSVLSDATYTVRDTDLNNGEVKYGSIGKHLDTSTEASSTNDATVHKESCCERGQKHHPKINHSNVCVSRAAFPFADVLSRQCHRKPSLVNQQSEPFVRSSAPLPPKAFKFDPPTFTYGSASSRDSIKEAPVEAETRHPSPVQDSYVVPTHLLGVKWSTRDVECLVECSKRWLCNTKRFKVHDERKKDEAPEETVKVTTSSLYQVDS